MLSWLLAVVLLLSVWWALHSSLTLCHSKMTSADVLCKWCGLNMPGHISIAPRHPHHAMIALVAPGECAWFPISNQHMLWLAVVSVCWLRVQLTFCVPVQKSRGACTHASVSVVPLVGVNLPNGHCPAADWTRLFQPGIGMLQPIHSHMLKQQSQKYAYSGPRHPPAGPEQATTS